MKVTPKFTLSCLMCGYLQGTIFCQHTVHHECGVFLFAGRLSNTECQSVLERTTKEFLDLLLLASAEPQGVKGIL